MWRALVAILLLAMPLVPATAVVAIDTPARDEPVGQPLAQLPIQTGLSYGEMAAAIGGLMIFAVALGSRRRTVSA